MYLDVIFWLVLPIYHSLRTSFQSRVHLARGAGSYDMMERERHRLAWCIIHEYRPSCGYLFHLDPILSWYAYFNWIPRLTSVFVHHLARYLTGAVGSIARHSDIQTSIVAQYTSVCMDGFWHCCGTHAYELVVQSHWYTTARWHQSQWRGRGRRCRFERW